MSSPRGAVMAANSASPSPNSGCHPVAGPGLQPSRNATPSPQPPPAAATAAPTSSQCTDKQPKGKQAHLKLGILLQQTPSLYHQLSCTTSQPVPPKQASYLELRVLVKPSAQECVHVGSSASVVGVCILLQLCIEQGTAGRGWGQCVGRVQEHGCTGRSCIEWRVWLLNATSSARPAEQPAPAPPH